MKAPRIELHAVHESMVGKRIRPKDMTSMEMTAEQREAIERICLGIFADMNNVQRSLTEILMACYLSGVTHTLEIIRDN